MFIIDYQRMRDMLDHPPRQIASTDLCRDGRAFFVGGQLPIRETLETMFMSDCGASTDLFVVTFGNGSEAVRHGIEMVQLIKRNFNIRILVRLADPVQDLRYAQIYAAGADLLEIGEGGAGSVADRHWKTPLATFPRWSTAAALRIDGSPVRTQVNRIDTLLHSGVVPLPHLVSDGAGSPEKEAAAVLQHLVKAWRQHKVAIKPFCPLIGLTSPLVQRHKPGALRTLFDRLHERRQLAAADLLRHLRVTTPTDSLDSAGL